MSMITTKSNLIHVDDGKRIKVETTYEWVPIIGNIIGYWRQTVSQKVGIEIVLNMKTSLAEYDRLIINGQEVPIPKESLTNQL